MSLLKNALLITLILSSLSWELYAATAKKKTSTAPKVSLEEKIKTCGEILKNKFPDQLINEKLETKLSATLDNRVELAFGRVALAYLKLQSERDKGREWEAKHVGEKLVNMQAKDKELADKLFAMIEKDPPEENVAKAKEYLQGLMEYSKHLDLKPHQKMEESDITIMSGFLGGEADIDSDKGYGKIFRELREIAVLKGGRTNKDLTGAVAKKIDNFNLTKGNYVKKSQDAILAEIRNIKELSPDCKQTLQNLLITRQTAALRKLEPNCEVFAFLESAFPEKKVKGFSQLNKDILQYLLAKGVDQSEPDQVQNAIRRAGIKCRNMIEKDGQYTFELSAVAPRKTFTNWSFKDPKDGTLKPLVAPEQKYIKTKKGKVPAKEGRISFALPTFTLSKDKIDQKVMIVSDSGDDFEYIEPAKSCRTKAKDDPLLDESVPKDETVAETDADSDSSDDEAQTATGTDTGKDGKTTGPGTTSDASTKAEKKDNKPDQGSGTSSSSSKKDPQTGASGLELSGDKHQKKDNKPTKGSDLQLQGDSGSTAGKGTTPKPQDQTTGQNTGDNKGQTPGPSTGGQSTETASDTATASGASTASDTATATNTIAIEGGSCSFDIDTNGRVSLVSMTLKGPADILNAKVEAKGKSTTVTKKDEIIGIFDFKLGLPPVPEKLTITVGANKTELNLADCGNIEELKTRIEEDKKQREAEKKEEAEAKAKEAKDAEIRAACDGGEGKTAVRNAHSFILCKNGVSDGERKMISDFCKGQSGEYDAQADKIYCAPYNSQAPQTTTIPSLPASIFSGVYGLTLKGFN